MGIKKGGRGASIADIFANRTKLNELEQVDIPDEIKKRVDPLADFLPVPGAGSDKGTTTDVGPLRDVPREQENLTPTERALADRDKAEDEGRIIRQKLENNYVGDFYTDPVMQAKHEEGKRLDAIRNDAPWQVSDDPLPDFRLATDEQVQGAIKYRDLWAKGRIQLEDGSLNNPEAPLPPFVQRFLSPEARIRAGLEDKARDLEVKGAIPHKALTDNEDLFHSDNNVIAAFGRTEAEIRFALEEAERYHRTNQSGPMKALDKDGNIIEGPDSYSQYEQTYKADHFMDQPIMGPNGTSLPAYQFIRGAFNVNRENKDALSSAMTATLAALYQDVGTKAFHRQATSADEDKRTMGPRSQEQYNSDISKLPNFVEVIDPEVKKGLFSKELRTTINKLSEGLMADHATQPYLNYLLDWIGDNVFGILNPYNPEDVAVDALTIGTPTGGVAGRPDISQGGDREARRLAAAIVLHYWIRKGWITFGKDEYGRFLPMNTILNPFAEVEPNRVGKRKEGEDEVFPQEVDVNEFNYKPSRSKNVSALNMVSMIHFPNRRGRSDNSPPKASLAPVPGGDRIAGDLAPIIFDKKGKAKRVKGNTSKNTVHLRNNTGIKVNQRALNALRWMFDKVLGGDKAKTGEFLQNPLAANLGELAESDFKKYASERGSDSASAEISHNIDNIGRDIAERIMPRAMDGKTRYVFHYLSDPTNRLFPYAEDLNYYNNKALIRSTLAFANSTPLNIKFNQKTRKSNIDDASVLRIANDVLNTSAVGRMFGRSIGKKLEKLHREDPTMGALLDYYYALGYHIMKLEDRSRLPWEFGQPIDVIEYAIRNKKDYINLSRQINKLFPDANFDEQGNVLTTAKETLADLGELDPRLEKIFLKGKGEWQYPFTIISELAPIEDKMADAIANPNKSFIHNFTYIFEQDGRMSNGALISLVMGDSEVAALLGVLPDGAATGKEGYLFKDMREQIFAQVNQDVRKVLTNRADDGRLIQAWEEFFNRMKADESIDAPKVYARELTVAALYGKAVRMMFTEAANILSAMPHLAKDLKDAYDNHGKFANTETGQAIPDATIQLKRDMAQIMNVGAQRAMGKLLTYSAFYKSFFNIMGKTEGPTIMPGVLPDEPLVMSADNWVNTYDVATWLDPHTGLQQAKVSRSELTAGSPGALGGWTIGKQGKIIQDPAVASIKTNTHEGSQSMAMLSKVKGHNKDTINVIGSQMQNGANVNFIQSMDFGLMALASVIAQGDPPKATIKNTLFPEPTDLPSRAPLPVLSIHDAMITTAGSTLKILNAYNNIAYPWMALNAPKIHEQVWYAFREHMSNLRQFVDDKLPDTQFVEEEYDNEGNLIKYDKPKRLRNKFIKRENPKTRKIINKNNQEIDVPIQSTKLYDGYKSTDTYAPPDGTKAGDNIASVVDIGTTRIFWNPDSLEESRDALRRMGMGFSFRPNGSINFPGVTEYFDIIWAQLEADDFFTPYELSRTRVSNDGSEKTNADIRQDMRDRAEEVLKAAEDHGYLRPLKHNMAARRNKKVTKWEFKRLLQMMEENERLLPREVPKRNYILTDRGGMRSATFVSSRVNEIMGYIDDETGERRPGKVHELFNKLQKQMRWLTNLH